MTKSKINTEEFISINREILSAAKEMKEQGLEPQLLTDVWIDDFERSITIANTIARFIGEKEKEKKEKEKEK